MIAKVKRFCTQLKVAMDSYIQTGRRKDQRFAQCFDQGESSPERTNSDNEKCPRTFVSEDIQEVVLQIDG